MAEIINLEFQWILKLDHAMLAGIIGAARQHVERIQQINLCPLSARTRTALLKQMARFKMIAGNGDERFLRRLRDKVAGLGHELTEQETLEMLIESVPEAFEIYLR